MTVDSDSIRRALTGDNRTPYKFAGDGPSLIRDAAAAMGLAVGVDSTEARQRLSKYAAAAVEFATINTTTAADVVRPGYRTVTELVARADRPLASAANRASIDDASPFVVPNVAGDDTTGDHTEGDPVPEGAVVMGIAGTAVTPQGVAGKLPLTRELVDSASPAGDLIALAAMREDYGRQVEARIYTELNTAAAGTITSGFVPSGAQVSTSTGTAVTVDLKKAFARYAGVRRRKPRNAIVAAAPAEVLAEGLDESTGDSGALWRPMGVAVNASVVPFGAGATDADVVILGSNDLWLWESPLLEFRYGQKDGPEIVEAVVWGYVAVRLVRPIGLSAIRWAAS